MKEPKDPADRSGDEFQQSTKYFPESMQDWSPAWEEQTARYKQYPGAPVLRLPEPLTSGGRELWTVLAGRRSFREFKGGGIGLETLSQLLWACQGITAREDGFEFRSAPSAGALYPLETYLACHRVEGAEPGLYHYDVHGHRLERLQQGDFRQPLMQAAFMQPVVSECAAVFLWCAVVKRSRWKYRQRAWRYIYLDAGHLAQNLLLAAEASGLGACLVGAFYDDEVNRLLGLDGEQETAVYLCVVGPR